MKRLFAVLLVLSVVLCGCGAKTETAAGETTEEAPVVVLTEAPTTEPATEPTEAPTEPEVYVNPLNGKILDAPFDSRIYAVTINNLREAMPHIGVQDADIFMEMYVNGSIVRGLALYTDPARVPAIGSVRSTRVMFTQLAKRYGLVVAHAGGSDYVLEDVEKQGIDNFSIDVSDDAPYAFRDKDRAKHYTWDACLFARGEGLEARAQELGIDIHSDPEKDYLLRFTEDGTPAQGEAADVIHLTLTYKSSRATSRKDTNLIYDAGLGRYIYNQYGENMVDGRTGEPESFRNVIIMLADITTVDHGYQKADFEKGGEGYFACGGKIIPILWSNESDTEPFLFTTQDGEPLELGTGNTYLAITQNGSSVTWEQTQRPEPAETVQPAGEEQPQGTVSADEDYL